MKQFLFLTALTLLSRHISAQCTKGCTLDIVQTSTCEDGRQIIRANTDGPFLFWQSGENNSSIVDSNNMETTIYPLEDATFTAYALRLDTNLVTNGDFNDSTTGFTSEFTLIDTNYLSQGQYNIGPNPANFSPAFISQSDHSGDNGYMMVIDGNQTDTIFFYETVIPVIGGNTYRFEAWFNNVHHDFIDPNEPNNTLNVPEIFIMIDSVPMLQQKLPYDTGWTLLTFLYSATLDTNIRLSMYDVTYEKNENDFAIDDVGFFKADTLSAQINVKTCMGTNVFSPDGDGQFDEFFIQDEGDVKIYDLGGKVVRELNSPVYWDGRNESGELLPAGYYVVLVNDTKIYRVSIIR